MNVALAVLVLLGEVLVFPVGDALAWWLARGTRLRGPAGLNRGTDWQSGLREPLRPPSQPRVESLPSTEGRR
jgi:hypothetical protein